VDIQKGPGVDVVCRVETILDAFGKESFDVVISTELIEHVREWRTVISNIKHICRGNGILVITTRSRGFHYHGYPYDFWRYELADMEYIFSDCVIERLEKDRLAPGVFMRARKPKDFVDKELADYALHSIIVNRRVREIDENSLQNFQRKYRRRQFFKRLERRMRGFIPNRGTTVRREEM
jgi:SAM-dependent methyltransferase